MTSLILSGLGGQFRSQMTGGIGGVEEIKQIKSPRGEG